MAYRRRKRVDFMDLVQLHEREWGTDSYPGRPSLEDILAAKVVLFWMPFKDRRKRHIITVHGNGKSIRAYVTHMLLNVRDEPPDRRLDKIFVNKQEALIKGVDIIYEKVDDEGTG